jgi:hypothetical protein
MTDTKRETEKDADPKFIKTFSILTWIKYFLGPFILGVAICGGIWIATDNMMYRLGGLFILISGIIVGVVFANTISSEIGTLEFDSELLRAKDWEKMGDKLKESKEENHEKYKPKKDV